jgi:hypothetical protein
MVQLDSVSHSEFVLANRYAIKLRFTEIYRPSPPILLELPEIYNVSIKYSIIIIFKLNNGSGTSNGLF